MGRPAEIIRASCCHGCLSTATSGVLRTSTVSRNDHGSLACVVEWPEQVKQCTSVRDGPGPCQSIVTHFVTQERISTPRPRAASGPSLGLGAVTGSAGTPFGAADEETVPGVGLGPGVAVPVK
jgi:hypothetical protein